MAKEEQTQDPWDLDSYDEEYEKAEKPERGDGEFETIPDGTYQVNVETVELKKSQKGNTYLAWSLRIIGPKFAGRMLWKNNMIITPKNIQWLKSDLSIAGLPKLPKLSMLPDFLEELLDNKIEITVRNRDENNQDVFFNKRIEQGSKASEDQGEAPEDDDDGLPF